MFSFASYSIAKSDAIPPKMTAKDRAAQKAGQAEFLSSLLDASSTDRLMADTRQKTNTKAQINQVQPKKNAQYGKYHRNSPFLWTLLR